MSERVYPTSLPWKKYPTFRDGPVKSGGMWLKGKQVDDGAEGLWRIHNELYDLSEWTDKHPGGSDWIQLTKGTDITEAFESHHVNDTAEKYLKLFHVRSAKSPRNSPFTFKSDGFYMTLKKRAREVLKNEKSSGSTLFSKLLLDSLLAISLILSILAAAKSSFFFGALSGLFLAWTIICSHNFVHQKDSFRVYYLDLSLMSSRDWRISHNLSHHLFPNTIQDLEISLIEPALQFIPWTGKSKLARYGPMLYEPLLYFLTFHYIFIGRMIDNHHGSKLGLRKADFIPLLIPTLMLLIGGASLPMALVLWTWVTIIASFVFSAIGVNAAHHHPDLFHEGDAPRKDLDWGLQQLDAVRDRPIISKYNMLALIFFGHHGLHHLFPTMDHVLLEKLYPCFKKTCKEFGIDYKPYSSIELIRGQFLQAARAQPNSKPPGTR